MRLFSKALNFGARIVTQLVFGPTPTVHAKPIRNDARPQPVVDAEIVSDEAARPSPAQAVATTTTLDGEAEPSSDTLPSATRDKPASTPTPAEPAVTVAPTETHA